VKRWIGFSYLRLRQVVAFGDAWAERRFANEKKGKTKEKKKLSRRSARGGLIVVVKKQDA
jgi:hypothetical protein